MYEDEYLDGGIRTGMSVLEFPRLINQFTMGVYLQKAGYNTGYFGKYLNWPGMAPYCDIDHPGLTPPGWNYVGESPLRLFMMDGFKF